MRRGGRILVLFGVILGLITAGGVFLFLMMNQNTGQNIVTRQVVVAQQNIPGRTEILPEAVALRDWPEAALPPEVYDKTALVTGKLAVNEIDPGQIILPQMLIDKEAVKEKRSNASFVIPEGKIGVAFPISSLSGVAGAIQNGDTVDVLLTLSPNTGVVVTGTVTVNTPGQGQPVSQVMLQDILVLNVGTWPGPGGADKNAPAGGYITFALNQQDALALKSAREQGTIELVLRHAGEHKPVTTEPVNLQYLNKRFNFNLIPTKGQ